MRPSCSAAASSPGGDGASTSSPSNGLKGGWASILKPPSARDIRGKRRAHKALDAPRRAFDYLVVLDFEWTADNSKGFGPPEIIEFPSVLVRGVYPFDVIDSFQVYVRPTINPTLTAFIKDLTAITQEQVENGVELGEALRRYDAWLVNNGLVRPTTQPATRTGSSTCRSSDDTAAPTPAPSGGAKRSRLSASSPTFAIVTWGDADVMGVLHAQLKRSGTPRPAYFDAWINLKALFKQHYKKRARRREPKGGLQRVVEGCGLTFDGRAHSGLVRETEEINTHHRGV